MISNREMRRIAGFVCRYFPDRLLGRVVDPRHELGQRWKVSAALLRAVLCGHVAGCKGLKDLEALTAEMSPAVRLKLGIPRRLPDTTMRDFVCAVDPQEITKLLGTVGYDAWRRKALHKDPEFPWGVMSFDGKYPTLRDVGDSDKGVSPYLQVHHDKDGQPLYGTVRTITAVLLSAAGRPILGATPVPGNTNEVGFFRKAFDEMVQTYGRLFRVVMYDAGGASRENFKAVKAAGKDAIFQIANPEWVMYRTFEELMRERDADFSSEEVVSQRKRIVRHVTVLPVKPLAKDTTTWEEIRTTVKVYSETFEAGVCTGTKTRYYVSTLEHDELSPEQWLSIVVKRWGVESAHQILDTAFSEDKRPWITADAQGALVVMLLRRVAYTALTLFKFITTRSEDKQLEPWRVLLERIKDVLKWAQDQAVAGLRPRSFAIPPALA